MNLLNMQVFRRLIMEEQTIYDLNRAVHLARSEVFFDMSVERIRECVQEHAEDQRKAHTEIAIYCLQSALEHATIAAKASHADPREKAFVRLLQMALSFLSSAHALIENEEELQDAESPLRQLLNLNSDAAEPRQFTSSSEQLLQDAVRLLDMAQEPLRDLRRTIANQMDEGDTARHEAARTGLREHYADLEHHCRTHSRPNFLFSSRSEI